jgi:hypothetical protein
VDRAQPRAPLPVHAVPPDDLPEWYNLKTLCLETFGLDSSEYFIVTMHRVTVEDGKIKGRLEVGSLYGTPTHFLQLDLAPFTDSRGLKSSYLCLTNMLLLVCGGRLVMQTCDGAGAEMCTRWSSRLSPSSSLPRTRTRGSCRNWSPTMRQVSNCSHVPGCCPALRRRA